MLPVKNRLTTPSDFYKIKKFGKRLFNSFFSISYINDTELDNSLYSVVISKALAKKSSSRNKIKRITRALVIKNRLTLPKKIKCVIYPKPSIIAIKNRDLEVEFLKLFAEIK